MGGRGVSFGLRSGDTMAMLPARSARLREERRAVVALPLPRPCVQKIELCVPRALSQVASEGLEELHLRVVLDHVPVSHDDLRNGPLGNPDQETGSFRTITEQQGARRAARHETVGDTCPPSARYPIEEAIEPRQVEGQVGENQSPAGKVEEDDLGETTHRTENSEIQLSGPGLWPAPPEILCGWELWRTFGKARGCEQGRVRIPSHELGRVDVVKGVGRHDVPDDTDGIDRSGGLRSDESGGRDDDQLAAVQAKDRGARRKAHVAGKAKLPIEQPDAGRVLCWLGSERSHRARTNPLQRALE